MKIPWWKLRREIYRVGHQLLEPYQKFRDVILRVKYKVRHEHHVKHFDGEIPWSSRVAVFLIYQPNGVVESIINTCEFLIRNGYACVIVSNGHLSEMEKIRIRSVVSHLIVRPNFGYDFGGYQEAILWLFKLNMEIDRLLILNDSIWFPVFPESTFLSDMERSGADVVGALSAQRGSKQRHQRKLFYASFMLLFSGKVCSSSVFKNFWKNYRQTSSKSTTIRNGERKLSALFIYDQRFTHHVMVDQVSYKRLIDDDKIGSWPLLVQDLIIVDPKLDKDKNELLAYSGSDIEDRWKKWYQNLCETQNMFVCSQIPLIMKLGVPFIKKSRDHQNLLMLKNGLDLFEACGEIDSQIIKEIKLHIK
jgi:hypothetical protein